MAEMQQCKSQTLDFITGLNLLTDRKGRFDLLIGPERPANYKGNFLLSRKLLACPSNDTSAVKEAKWLAVREIFSDWENEIPLELDIVRLDSAGLNKPPINIEQLTTKLNNIAKPNNV